jgi:hypothetical protein
MIDASYIIGTSDDERQIVEAELEAGLDAIRGEIEPLLPWYGRIQIVQSGSASPLFEAEDELWYLVSNYCFHIWPDLLNGKPVEVNNYTYVGKMTIRPSGEFVHFEGGAASAVSLPIKEAAAALFHCGRRFVAALRQFPTAVNDVGLLDTEAARAHEALQRHGVV